MVLTQDLKEKSWFGYAEVDIEIPERLHPKFEEMCPFFHNKAVPATAVPEHMRKYLKKTGRKRGEDKKLMGTLSAQKILAVRPAVAMVHRPRGGNNKGTPHNRLQTKKDLHMVRGTGDRSAADRRCGQKQGPAGGCVQTSGKQRLREADRSVRAPNKRNLHKGREGG